MSRARRAFSDETKRNIVEESYQIGPTKAQKKYKLGLASLYQWRKKFGKPTTPLETSVNKPEISKKPLINKKPENRSLKGGSKTTQEHPRKTWSVSHTITSLLPQQKPSPVSQNVDEGAFRVLVESRSGDAGDDINSEMNTVCIGRNGIQINTGRVLSYALLKML